jgi:hypothetical protein
MRWFAAVLSPQPRYKRHTEEVSYRLHAIGIDLGKTVFHLVGLDLRGKVLVRKQLDGGTKRYLQMNRLVEIVAIA